MSTIEIQNILKENSEINAGKAYLENMMYYLFRIILNEIILEYPKILDAAYCELFLGSIQNRLETLYTSFRPLKHISLQDSKNNSRLVFHTQNISGILAKIPNLVIDIQTREELAMPLLKCIESSLKVIII